MFMYMIITCFCVCSGVFVCLCVWAGIYKKALVHKIIPALSFVPLASLEINTKPTITYSHSKAQYTVVNINPS